MIRIAREKLTRTFLLALLLALALPGAGLAGGWAVVTLDRLPQDVVAGQPYTVGFKVRQHGQTPWVVESIPIEARNAATAQRLTFTALPDGEEGHYSAELLFPEAGEWHWQIYSGLFPESQPMPALTVLEGAGAAAGAGGRAAAQARPSWAVPLAVLSLASLAAGVLLVVRRRGRLQAGIGIAALLAAVAGLAFAMIGPVQARQAKPAGPAAAGLAETGRQLYLAKGCIVCHSNDRALKGSREFGVEMGPDLSRVNREADSLRLLLVSPRAANPAADMPTLGLAPDEIEALVAFLLPEETE